MLVRRDAVQLRIESPRTPVLCFTYIFRTDTNRSSPGDKRYAQLKCDYIYFELHITAHETLPRQRNE